MLFMDVGHQQFSSEKPEVTPQCGHQGAELQADLKFIKLSFIPIIPLATNYQIKCKQCFAITATDKPKFPLVPWFNIVNKFIGLFLILLLMAYFINNYFTQLSHQATVQANPQVFDFYLLDKNKLQQQPYQRNDFTVAKITSIEGDNITLAIGNYTYSRKRDLIKAIRLDTLLYENFFSKKVHVFSHSQLQALHQQGVIYESLRPESYTLFGGLAVMPQQPKKLYFGYKPNPINQEGIRAYRAGDFKQALSLFQQASDKKDSWSQVNLAQMYRDGEGTPVNEALALKWYKTSVDNGNQSGLVEYQALCKKRSACD